MGGDFKSRYSETCISDDGSLGMQRCWYTFVPGSAASSPAPLVIDMHGWTGCAEHHHHTSHWKDKAEHNGFIVVWPQGTFDMPLTDGRSSWNAGGPCCAPANSQNIDDVGFILKVISKTISSHSIDQSRVYIAGHSAGCAMAQRVAVEASGIVAAAACHSMYLLVEPSNNFIPIPFMEIHGTSDNTVPYGNMGLKFFGFDAKANQRSWRDLNKCQGDAAETSHSGYTLSKYSTCEGGTEVALVSVQGADHFPYQGRDTWVGTTQLAWEFVKRFSKTPTDLGALIDGRDPRGNKDSDDIREIVLIGSAVGISRVAWSLVVTLAGHIFLQA